MWPLIGEFIFSPFVVTFGAFLIERGVCVLYLNAKIARPRWGGGLFFGGGALYFFGWSGVAPIFWGIMSLPGAVGP